MVCIMIYLALQKYPYPLDQKEKQMMVDEAIKDLASDPAQLLNIVEGHRWYFNDYEEEEKFSLINQPNQSNP